MKPNLLVMLRRDKQGATAIEYGLILSLMVIAIIGSLSAFAGGSMVNWNKVDTAVQQSVKP